MLTEVCGTVISHRQLLEWSRTVELHKLSLADWLAKKRHACRK